MQSVVNLSKEVSQRIKLTKMCKIGDETDSKNRLGTKLRTSIKFGNKMDVFAKKTKEGIRKALTFENT